MLVMVAGVRVVWEAKGQAVMVREERVEGAREG